jgi:hypothetical protein
VQPPPLSLGLGLPGRFWSRPYANYGCSGGLRVFQGASGSAAHGRAVGEPACWVTPVTIAPARAGARPARPEAAHGAGAADGGRRAARGAAWARGADARPRIGRVIAIRSKYWANARPIGADPAGVPDPAP